MVVSTRPAPGCIWLSNRAVLGGHAGFVYSGLGLAMADYQKSGLFCPMHRRGYGAHSDEWLPVLEGAVHWEMK